MLTKETRIKIPDDIDNLYFCGDIHANLDYIKYFIKTGVGFKNKISNSCIILCGDGSVSKYAKNIKVNFTGCTNFITSLRDYLASIKVVPQNKLNFGKDKERKAFCMME